VGKNRGIADGCDYPWRNPTICRGKDLASEYNTKKKCLSSGIEIFMVLNILLLFLKFVKEVGTIFQK